jgi:hypothetical protein
VTPSGELPPDEELETQLGRLKEVGSDG